MNEQRKNDLVLLVNRSPSDHEFMRALERQLPAMVRALYFLNEHGEAVRQALDAETTNPRSPIALEPLLEAFRAYPRSL